MNFFQTFPKIMFSTLHYFEKTIKMIGHHSHLRDVIGQSYPIYACTRANHAHYSLVQVTFCGSSKHSFLKYYLGKNLTGRKCGAYRTISYKICGNITLFKTIICTLLLCNKKRQVTTLVQKKMSIYFPFEICLREIYFVVYMHALICAR